MTTTTPDQEPTSLQTKAFTVWLYRFLTVCVIGLIATAVLPLFPVDWWWVRIGDFPRVQLLVAYVIGLQILLIYRRRPAALPLAIGLLASIGIQIYWIFPWLPIAPLEVQWARSDDADRRIRILSANVLQENEESEPLLQLIEETDPDLVVLCEINGAWEQRLRPLKDLYPWHLVHPLENKYGIAMFTRLDVSSASVKHLVVEEIPSIDAKVRLRSGHVVHLFAVHPNPPRPGEDTTKRDGELVLVGREVDASESAIVLGDLNDVGWSRTTNLFQEVSGLLDPRKGRGLYPTFDVTSSIWRYPLDYLFHSDDFRLVDLQRLADIGSDHFPLLVELSHEPRASIEQESPHLDAGDQQDANDAVDNARDAVRSN